jgi:methionyl-tRNA synthetase
VCPEYIQGQGDNGGMIELWETVRDKFIDQCLKLQFNSALKDLFDFIGATNKYIDTMAPWKLAKSSDNEDKLALSTTLAVAAECVRLSASALYPVMPNLTIQIFDLFALKSEEFSWKTWLFFGNSLSGNRFAKSAILFPKIDSSQNSG